MLAQSKALEFAIHTLFNVGHLYYRLFFAYGVAALALDVFTTFGAASVKPLSEHAVYCSKGCISLRNEPITLSGPYDNEVILSRKCSRALLGRLSRRHRLCLRAPRMNHILIVFSASSWSVLDRASQVV